MQPSYSRTYVWAISLAAAMGGLLFGYDWVVIGGAKPFYEKFFNLTSEAAIGWAMSCALIGCLIGAMASGGLSDRFGRKRLLILSALLFIVSSIGTGMAGTFAEFVVWRMAGGVAIGMASNLSPMYIAEVAPAAIRGRLVSMNQLTIVIGILAAQVVNWLIGGGVPREATASEILDSWYGQSAWRWMFAATAVPSVFFLVFMLFVPESPRWLAKSGRREQAREILARVFGSAGADQALMEIEATLTGQSEGVDFKALLDPRTRRILWIGVIVAVIQQWCGINVIFNYAEEVFAAAGYHVSDILVNIVVTGTVNLLFTFVALYTVDWWGRRILMLAGFAGLTVIYVLIGACYHAHSEGLHVLVLVVTAIACYACTLAPVTWVVISELFPNRVRGAAMSISVTALWTACFALTYTFPLLNRRFGPANTFWTYAAICVVGFVFIRLRLPETKGKTLEEIEAELGG